MTTMSPEAAVRNSARGAMRAAVLAGPGTVRIEAVPLPEPGEGQVRVRVQGCGVCGSNIPVWEGRPWFRYPMGPGAPGHEGYGLVDATGHGAEHLRAGDRVAFLSYHAFAQFDVADAAAVVKLPGALGEGPFPGEALGCAVNVFERCGIERGQTVAVIGIGFLGALLTGMAARAGATVVAISRRRCALEVARAMGAAETIVLGDQAATVDAVKRITGEGLCGVVIEAVGTQGPLDLATELTGIRGRLVIAGYHQDGMRHVNMQMWNWRGLDVVNAHERDPLVYVRGMRRAAEMVAAGTLDPSPLYTHLFPLERLAAAMEAARTRPDGFMKALVTP